MHWKQLLMSISASVDDELRLRNAYIATENRILRQQITGRVQLSDGDRRALAELGQKLGKKALEEVATLVKPDTILAWHRKFASQQGGDVKPCQSVGRPRIDQEIETLVVRMARENRSWGYDRIVGALANLGLTVSDQTVGNILKRHGLPPAPERQKSMPWGEFIHIHMDMLMATDFFASAVWTQCTLVIASLLCCFHGDCHHRGVAGTALRHSVRWMLSFLAWSFAWHAFLERLVRLGKQAPLSRLMRCGPGVRRPLLSMLTTAGHCASLPRSRGNVVRMPIVNACQIRDGPLHHRRQRDTLLHNTNREAA
jgi:transposase